MIFLSKQLKKNMAFDGKRQYKESVTVSAPDLEKGTIRRLRKETGINFSNPPANNDNEKSELKTMIKKFALDNTIEVPDKRKVKQGIRYRKSSKLSLFECFDSQYPNNAAMSLSQGIGQQISLNQRQVTWAPVCT